MLIKISLAAFLIILVYEIATLWGIIIGGFRKEWKRNKLLWILSFIMVLFITVVTGALVVPIARLWRLI